jgi:hypothetical protein
VGDGGGETVPVCGFLIELFAAETRECVELGAAIVFAGLPFRRDPALLLEFVKSGIERAVADLENVSGDLGEALADGPTVEGLESEDFEDEKIECALEKVGRFGHGCVGSLGYRDRVRVFLSVSKGKSFGRRVHHRGHRERRREEQLRRKSSAFKTKVRHTAREKFRVEALS